MPFLLPEIRVGEPSRHASLSVFPLFVASVGTIEYRLAADAIADGSLVVREVSEGGSVSDLMAENRGGIRILFLEGEELIGAKQNRILNTSVLVAPHSTTRVPVSCVEQNRWGYRSRHFGSSGSHAPSSLRRSLKSSVTRSVRQERSHRSDQAQVWRDVATLHETHGVHSGTAAMSDAFETHGDKVAEYQQRLGYVDGAFGFVFAIGDDIVSYDLFDKPETCRSVWARFLSGTVFDALAAGQTESSVSVTDVERWITDSREMAWEPTDAVGEGLEYRAESTRGDQASALAYRDTLVHGNLLAPASGGHSAGL